MIIIIIIGFIIVVIVLWLLHFRKRAALNRLFLLFFPVGFQLFVSLTKRLLPQSFSLLRDLRYLCEMVFEFAKLSPSYVT